MRRLLLLLLICMLCAVPSLAELAEVQPVLHDVTTVEEAARFVDFTADDGGEPTFREVQAGRIRHIPQDKKSPEFLADCWIVESCDLTAEKSPNGIKYKYYCGTMCTRAVYCEVLSYFGIGYTPAELSQLLHTRDIDSPYDDVTALIDGLERVPGNSYNELPQMLDNYFSDPSYSPVMITLISDSGRTHSLLVLGRISQYEFVVLDTSGRVQNGEVNYITTIRLAQNYRYVKQSGVSSYNKNYVRAAYQWHWTGD